MRNYGGLVHAVGVFARHRGGNFAVLFSLAASVLALAVGFSVNVSQLYNAKSSLQGVVDAAVTSTARDLTTGVIKETDANTSVQVFLDANSQAGILQADQVVMDKLIVDRTAKTVQVDAHVDVALYFPILGMGDMKRVAASTTALYSDKKVEVAMMLDITGSMAKRGNVDKIGDLKAAAKNAVQTMLQNQDPKNPRIRVAIVPYASGVNAGKLAENVYAEKQGGSESATRRRQFASRCQDGQKFAAVLQRLHLHCWRGDATPGQLRHRAQGQEWRCGFERRRPRHGSHG